MLIQQKSGTLKTTTINNRNVDWLPLEWYETNKRILRKTTMGGIELQLKFLNEAPALTQDDVLHEGNDIIIAVEIIPCEVMMIKPKSMQEMAAICYEIGNKHLHLFFENDELLVPYEAPLFRLLISSGYELKQENRKLLYPLKTSVQAHAHDSGGGTLFSKIMQLTNSTK